MPRLASVYLEGNRFNEEAVNPIRHLFQNRSIQVHISIYDPTNMSHSLSMESLEEVLTHFNNQAKELDIPTKIDILLLKEKETQLTSFILFLKKLPMMKDWGNTGLTKNLLQILFNIIESMLNSEENLRLMEALALESSESCGDRVALGFMKMAISHTAPSTEGLTLESLYPHAKKMSRFDAIEEISLKKASSLTGVIDEIEVVLKYFKDLNEPLELGLPLNDMLYEFCARVESSDITSAETDIKKGEPDSIFNWMIKNDKMARSITKIRTEFERLENLPEFDTAGKLDESSNDYKKRCDVITKRLNNAKKEFLKKLYTNKEDDHISFLSDSITISL
jgi:hypothetical protein